jgi:hypothetical protein
LTGLLLVSSLLLHACSLPLLSESPPGIPSGSADGLTGRELLATPNLLKYYDWLVTQSAEAVEREHEISRANFETRPDALNRLRLALVLCVPGTPFRDYGTARSLMTDYLEGVADERAEDRGLAQLVLGFIEENERARRQRFAAEKRMKKDLETREILEDRVQELENQVEQLKAIEDGLMETEQSINVPAQPAASND